MREPGRFASTLAAAIVLLTVGAAVTYPHLSGTPESRRELRAKASLDVVAHALVKYAQQHEGEYPPTSAVKGGGSSKGDALIRGGYLVRYPPNAFNPEKRIENIPSGIHSPGDFVYRRDPRDKYKCALFVWGANEQRRFEKNSPRPK